MRPNLQFQRRALILGAGASALAVGLARSQQIYYPHGSPALRHAVVKLKRIEAAMAGRLGVCVFETSDSDATGSAPQVLRYRGAERFPMCSTFKLSLVGAVLEAADYGKLSLNKRIAYGPKDLLEYAPTTRAHVAEGAMTTRDLCEAAVELSDNTAANLLLAEIGGPAALTARWRAWADPETRLDRNEPTLNSSIPSDPRDTTTPEAMAKTLGKLTLGWVLKPDSRALLLSWMRNCQTGLTKLRGGLPSGLVVGDKTGNSGKGTMGDLAIVDAPGHRPIIMVCYLTGAKVDAKAQDKVFVAVAGVASEFLGLTPAHG
jgi:beta-lactamase class A